MALFFSGTSTGNRYEVGRGYTMNGSTYIAQSDGSFRKEGAVVGTTDQGRVIRDNSGGQVLQGSAGNSSVDWYASGKDIPKASAGKGSVVSQSAAPTSAGEAVQKIASPQKQATAANRGAFVRDASSWSGKDEPPQDNIIAGQHWRASPRWTNAELFEARYGEVGETLIGLAVLGADIGYNARIAWDEQFTPKNQKVMAGAIEDAGDAALGLFFSALETVTSAANDRKAFEQRRDAAVSSAMDALDARLELQAEEWHGRAEVVNPHWTQERLAPNRHGY